MLLNGWSGYYLRQAGFEVAFEAHLVPETQSSFSGFVGAVLVYYVPRYSTGCQSVQGN